MSRSKHDVKVGDAVVFIDQHRREVNSIVQALHGSEDYISCINIVHLSQNPDKDDQYGRQTEHTTSLSYCGDFEVCVGNCWRYPEDTVEIDEGNVAKWK